MFFSLFQFTNFRFPPNVSEALTNAFDGHLLKKQLEYWFFEILNTTQWSDFSHEKFEDSRFILEALISSLDITISVYKNFGHNPFD